MREAYRDDDVVLHQGDALELGQVPPIGARLLAIDPPYARAGAIHTGRRAANAKQVESAGADQFWSHWFADVVRSVVPHLRPDGCGFVFADWRTMSVVESVFARAGSGWLVSQGLVWDRESIGLGTPFRAGFEMLAFVRGPDFHWEGEKNLGAVFRRRWPYTARKHPAEKPVGLLRQLIELTTEPGDVVLDCFAGAGSTLVAAKASGRCAVGVEIEEGWCDATVARLRGASDEERKSA